MTTAIDAQTVKKLRLETGVGMMTCKKALEENGGDYGKALESLRLKGIAMADKKASRNTKEGIIYSYIHTGSKLGILLEVNCETDFVARRAEFLELAKNIGMQIASDPDIEVVAMDEIPQETRDKVWKFESAKEDLQNKPENIRNKIIEGRVDKSLRQRVLLEQEFLCDPNITVEEYIKGVVGVLGENIRVKRFIRYVLGETETDS